MGIKAPESKLPAASAVQISQRAIDTILAEADRVHPHECCGLLFGSAAHIDRAVPTANVHPEPAQHFEIDPQALVDAHRAARGGGPELAGYYHSHPTGVAAPSATDRAQASGDGRVWVIAADGAISLWRDTTNGFAALSYAVTQG